MFGYVRFGLVEFDFVWSTKNIKRKGVKVKTVVNKFETYVGQVPNTDGCNLQTGRRQCSLDRIVW